MTIIHLDGGGGVPTNIRYDNKINVFAVNLA